MNKKYYHIIIALLVVLNVVSWRLWWEHPAKRISFSSEKVDREDRPEEGMRYLIRMLDLSSEQKKGFDQERKTYFSVIGEINDCIEESREELRESFYVNIPNRNDSLFKVIGQQKVELEKATFVHFNAMRNMCNDEQKPKLDIILQKMMNQFEHKPQKRKGGSGNRCKIEEREVGSKE